MTATCIGRHTASTIALLAALALLAAGSAAPLRAQTDTAADSSSGGFIEGIWTRDKLTGDWGGLRTDLGKHGIGIDLRFSQFYQDVTSGGADSGNNGAYGVKLDSFVNIDAQKLFGSWEGLSVSMHVETRAGDDVLGDAGAFVLPNSSLLYPLPGDYSGTQVTGLFVNQALFDGKAAVLAGKLNSFDLLQGMFPNITDYGLDGFMNANSMMSIVSWGRWLTLSQYGVAGWTIEGGMPSTGFIVTGTENTSDTWSNVKSSFDSGPGILAFHRFLYEIDSKQGYVYVGGGGSTQSYDSTDPADWTIVPGRGATSTGDGKAWGLAVYVSQNIWEDQKDDKRFVNVFFGGSRADNNVSFSDWDVFANIQAFGLFDARPNDRMGFGAHYYHLADNFVDTASTLPGVNLRGNFWTTEVYYNFEINPWLHLTPNFQYAQNENTSDDPAVILGARLVVDF